MKRVGLLVLAMANAPPVLAQAKPAPAQTKPWVKYAAEKRSNQRVDFVPAAKYGVKQCSSAALGNGDVPTDDLATWCAWHAPRATVALLIMRFWYAWGSGYPEPPPWPRCAPIRKLLDKPSHELDELDEAGEADTKRYMAAIDNISAQFFALPGAGQKKLDRLAYKCAVNSPNREDRFESAEILQDFLSSKNYNLGWNEAWKHAWDAGWDAGVKAQMALDGKVLRDVAAKDADRYNELVKDYNALAAQYQKALLPQPHGFWASLALALASRPASGTPGSLDSTCTEEVGAWPTTFNCGSTTCVREVGAWPATFDCH